MGGESRLHCDQEGMGKVVGGGREVGGEVGGEGGGGGGGVGTHIFSEITVCGSSATRII